jgi:hypothetical protein
VREVVRLPALKVCRATKKREEKGRREHRRVVATALAISLSSAFVVASPKRVLKDHPTVSFAIYKCGLV